MPCNARHLLYVKSTEVVTTVGHLHIGTKKNVSSHPNIKK